MGEAPRAPTFPSRQRGTFSFFTFFFFFFFLASLESFAVCMRPHIVLRCMNLNSGGIVSPLSTRLAVSISIDKPAHFQSWMRVIQRVISVFRLRVMAGSADSVSDVSMNTAEYGKTGDQQ